MPKTVTRTYNRAPSSVRRQAILDFIRSYRKTEGIPPTMKEIGNHIRATPSLVRYHLVCLHNEGYLTWDDAQHRTIRLLTRRRYTGA